MSAGDIADLYGGNPVETGREDAATGFDPMPAGWYPVECGTAVVTNTIAGNGKYLKLDLVVLGEKFANRHLFPNINLVNPSQKAVEIGMKELDALGQACGIQKLGGTEQLLQKQFDVRVKVKKGKDGYDDDNAVTAYASLGSRTGSTPAAPASAGQTWAPAQTTASAPASPKAVPKRPWER